MSTFDINILQRYYDAHNFEGAANYLESIPAKDLNSEYKKRMEIRKLRRDASIQNNIVNGMDPGYKEAFLYMQAMNGTGDIPRDRTITYNQGTEDEYHVTETNRWGTYYLDRMNNLKSKDGTSINKIAIDLDSDNSLAQISSVLGFNNINSNDLGITHKALGDGKHRLILSTDNRNLYKVYNAMKQIEDTSFVDIFDPIATRTATSGILGAGVGSFIPGAGTAAGGILGGATGAVVGTIEGLYNYFSNKSKASIKGIDNNGNIYDEDGFNAVALDAAVANVNKANEAYQKILETQISEQTFDVETETSQFLGLGHAEAYKALQNNIIDIDTYNKIEATWKEGYDRLIKFADFTKKKVYAWDASSGEGINLSRVNNVDIPDLKGEVTLAMKEGRCDYALATVDGRIGTMIYITPKNDDGDWSKAKGEIQKQIFIEGLFEESAEAMFDRDTKTVAARQNADMKKFNYEQKLSTGVTVGYKEGVPYIKQADNNGNIISIPISENDMLRALDENAIIDNSITTILGNMDENGNQYPQVINGEKVPVTVEQLLERFAIAGTEELYPQGSTTELSREVYKNQLYTKMEEVLNSYLKYYKNN